MSNLLARVNVKKILDACKSKSMCEGGDDIETVSPDGIKTVKKSHGGCGALQPVITIDGMKMVAEYKLRKKSDDARQLPEPAKRKQQLSAERVLYASSSNFMQTIEKVASDQENLDKAELTVLAIFTANQSGTNEVGNCYLLYVLSQQLLLVFRSSRKYNR
ncbi:Aspartate decarboxylase-like domain-containing protein [Artemisia annua]|uniref:Aspartate decarboxylase-like domain-containing protein n=1 Tax=Artemisia annua TaxID=35608 RepID=A0A2U1MK71_ARTAN|nr:Aspartate decarboxylase-like domain-containing protein [Artemisia annua]